MLDLVGSGIRPERGPDASQSAVLSPALQCGSMTNGKLASELQTISRELDEILANERAAATELDQRFAEDHGAIQVLLQSVQVAKLDGRWRNTRFNVFDVLGPFPHSPRSVARLADCQPHPLREAFLSLR